METEEAEHSLESVVHGHHVYKYIWIPCLGEHLYSVCIVYHILHVHVLICNMYYIVCVLCTIYYMY